MAFREHLGEFAGKAGHFLLEGFVVLHGVFDADIAARSEDVVLFGDVCGLDYGAEAFFILELAFLEFFEGAREAFNVLFAEVAVLAVHHVVQDKLDALHEHAAGTAAGVIDALADFEIRAMN